MPDLPHLNLPRVEIEIPRKLKRGFSRFPQVGFKSHGRALAKQIVAAVTSPPPPAGVDPALILRAKLSSEVDVDALRRAGLTIIGRTKERALILFSSDAHLREFSRRVAEYRRGPQMNRGNKKRAKNPPHAALISNILEIARLQASDRIGPHLRQSGVSRIESLLDGQEYLFDLELWHTGIDGECRERLDQVVALVQANGGRVTDTYVGSSLVLARIRVTGQVARLLLVLDSVSQLDYPPRIALTAGLQVRAQAQEFGEIQPPPEGSPGVCVIDSGVTPGHPILAPALGEHTAVPGTLGDGVDGHGHGTMVAGLALYGNVQGCIQRRAFAPLLTLYSARVLNADNRFDDERLIISQMAESIEYFRTTYGCRVFNVSLGDDRFPYNGGKVSPWASILDYLARDNDVVIVVSAGNYSHDPEPPLGPDDHLAGYPGYLISPPAKIIEPATGCNVVTVGSVAESASLPEGAERDVRLRPIAGVGEPSPFTRSGPGIGGAIKPDVVEYGGNRLFDGTLRRTRNDVESAVLSLNREYIQRLFTADTGTSFAAAKVSNLAASLLREFPNATANLVRALIAASAEIPAASKARLAPLGGEAVSAVCGNGVPNLDRARSSGKNRVVLLAESTIGLDRFHVYEVPIPDEFCSTDGVRTLSVSLAYDPPVRHSRLDYLGFRMSYRLIRGKTLDQVVNAFKKLRKGEGKVDGLRQPYDCVLTPTPTRREGGTLQKASFVMTQRPRDYGNTYYLVVRCLNEWAREDLPPQHYAVVGTVQHSAEIDLYAQIQTRVRERGRVRL